MDLVAVGELLAASGAVTQTHVVAVLGRRAEVDEAVLRAEFLTLLTEHEEAVAETLAERHQLPALVFGTSSLDLSLLDDLPTEGMRAAQVLPLAKQDGTIMVAVGTAAAARDPFIVEVGIRLVQRVSCVVAQADLLAVAIERALQLRAAGSAHLAGGRASDGKIVSLALARPPRAIALPRADSVARALGAVLDGVPEQVPAALRAPALGMLRLKQIRRPAPAPPPEEPPPTPAEEAAQLATVNRPFALIVEDDDAIGRLLSRALESDGCETFHVVSGDGVRTALSVRRPDILLLDAMLPGVHGFEICAALKSSPEWREVPIVMVSAVYRGFEQARDIQEQHGADAFIEKPFQIEHVRHVVANLLRRPLPSRQRSEAQETLEARSRTLVDHHMTLGEEDAAATVVDRWLAAEPLSARAWLERGNLAVVRGEHFDALRAYELAAVYDRKLFIAQVSLAMLYEQLGFSRKARETWQVASVVAPNNETADQIQAALASRA